jgi:K+-sensing histidine kinase KdpD
MHDGRRQWPVRVGVALLAPAVVAVALVPLRADVLNTNLALVLVVAVLGAAVTGGRIAGVVGALSAALSYDLFLTVPYGSLPSSAATTSRPPCCWRSSD